MKKSRRVLTNHTPLKNCSRLTVSRFIVSVTITVTFTSQTERAMFNTVIRRGLEKQQKRSRFKQCVTMGRKINIEEVRGFFEASNRQFEQGGIYLERALFKRDDNGVLTSITLSYEDRTTSDTQETRKEKQV